MKDKTSFIVLEGLDGAGTTTQADLLSSYLGAQGRSYQMTHEPTGGPVGRLIRRALTGNLEELDLGDSARSQEKTGEQPPRLSEETLCLLFAADRTEHSRWIEKMRSAGNTVVSDRYVYSSIAYQSLDERISPERVVEVNRGIERPSTTFFLNVPVADCLKRLSGRADAPAIYETHELLERVDSNYRAARVLYEKHFGSVIDIDGTLAPEDVHAEIVTHLR